MWPYVLGIFIAATLAVKTAYSEFDSVSPAVSYCLNYKGAVKLSDDHAILCFDGPINADRDTSAVYELKPGGFFVVRSNGGFATPAIILSNILLRKNATVIIYDYCLSACANYFLIASLTTHVVKGTIVAWHGAPQTVYCAPSDIEVMEKFHRNAIERMKFNRDAPDEYVTGVLSPELICKTGELSDAFFRQREIDNRHIFKPQTAYTRKMFDFAMKVALDKTNIFWMWNPKNHGDYFKSRIIYESYPSSQEVVDELIGQLGLWMRVFYDP
jgi:hypothetical protein